ncbi:DNA sulfur modification protein DndD [Alloalcanivorax marinus]|uniref:DNA sulfur modification protein DndD n=1 Tax=Alloalcanivorax marinus TaxID=1177169 RepID=UPI001931567B|nr:DNA sulfur modification protein DndD [Alloalcanivorax marinus]MBL7252027.1 DNA sulfur modification protein DndD [Alloalcanivorax marinus]
MLIKELVLRNYKIYEGENRFDLSPRKRYGKVRPIILFGGMNGAGKTSLLSALRLALYGRFSLGQSPTQKEYEDFLKKAIYRSKITDRAANEASVELCFTYAKLGTENHYRVIRSWKSTGKSVKENVEIFEDFEHIKGLGYEQAQNFLNELIPIGVSDLFFFDGEKIKELAEDTGGSALENSIKKLMGLDIIERLSGDLTVLNRNITKASSLGQINREIDSQQKLLDRHKASIEQYKSEISDLLVKRAELAQNHRNLQSRFDERGGHFSASRKDIEKKIDAESNRKSELEAEIVTLLSDALPLYLSGGFRLHVAEVIQKSLDEVNPLTSDKVRRSLEAELLRRLEVKFGKKELEEVSRALSELFVISSDHQAAQVHDLTPRQASEVIASFQKAIEQFNSASFLFGELEKCETSLDELGSALSRAPDDSLIRADFEKLQLAQSELSALEINIEALRSSAKKEAELAVECARKLDKLYEKAARSSDQARVLNYIGSTNNLIDDFVRQSSLSKIADLETQFSDCFSRLARKHDMNLSLKVNPETFKFGLLSKDGSEVDKSELSAGEKQIFAISILEALAKTSGRQLPMIVDTPLGRLDSNHRQKLVEEYFPRASHQMIILSTDTEVDEGFYKALSPEISRAFKLEYDPLSGSTQATEGYFWQQRG